MGRDSCSTVGLLLEHILLHLRIELINFIKFPVNFPSEEAQQKEKIYVIGSANGLICFSVGDYPSSRPNDWYDFRFGFDPKNDDYKIVKVITVEHEQSVEWLQVEVYSMRLGCWKLITQSPPSHYHYLHIGGDIHVCVDGYLHWLCGSHDDLRKFQSIVAFDLAAESFSEISLPDPMNTVDYQSRQLVNLGVFDGKLCVISCARGDCDCEVWVMDQYGSWVKNGFSHFHKDDIYPYGFTLKNNFIYEDCKEVIHYLYDPSAPFNKVKPFPKHYVGDTIIIPYVESLVWVTPPTC
ncbi:F-box domain-containing protein [Artemisia annua]|uniref:F-box domain-containing protein n=1 Tax=Artemisia annua TaxID=35608 RepID=A0A2U1PJ00_ARTAN|nr:F-box domain-containing protein [Artemisia annua]